VPGRKEAHSDASLRPALDPARLGEQGTTPVLMEVVRRLGAFRTASRALSEGDSRELHVAARQLAFLRTAGDESVGVAVNSSHQEATLALQLDLPDGFLVDLLDEGARFPLSGGKATVPVGTCDARILAHVAA